MFVVSRGARSIGLVIKRFYFLWMQFWPRSLSSFYYDQVAQSMYRDWIFMAQPMHLRWCNPQAITGHSIIIHVYDRWCMLIRIAYVCRIIGLVRLVMVIWSMDHDCTIPCVIHGLWWRIMMVWDAVHDRTDTLLWLLRSPCSYDPMDRAIYMSWVQKSIWLSMITSSAVLQIAWSYWSCGPRCVDYIILMHHHVHSWSHYNVIASLLMRSWIQGL